LQGHWTSSFPSYSYSLWQKTSSSLFVLGSYLPCLGSQLAYVAFRFAQSLLLHPSWPPLWLRLPYLPPVPIVVSWQSHAFEPSLLLFYNLHPEATFLSLPQHWVHPAPKRTDQCRLHRANRPAHCHPPPFVQRH